MAEWTDNDELEDIDQDLDDDEQDGEGGDGSGEGRLSADAQALVDQGRAEGRQEYARSLSESLSGQGLGIGQDGGLVLTNPQQFAGFFAPMLQQPQQDLLPPVPAAAEQDEAMPDVYAEPEKYAAWTERRVLQAAQGIADRHAERLQAMETMFAEREAEYAAVRVKESLRQYPALAYLADHPDFKAKFVESLAGTDPKAWRDPQFLVKVAAWCAPDLAPVETPQTPQQQPRDQEGRYAPQTPQQTRAEDRMALDQARPAQSLARSAGEPAVTEQEREIAQMLGVSIYEYRALGKGGNMKEYTAARQKREAREKARAGTGR